MAGITVNRTHFESAISEHKGQFYLIITISKGDSCWTSNPAELQATTWDAARTESVKQLNELIRILA